MVALQLDSVVLLKNENNAIQCGAPQDSYADKTVYIPQSYDLGFDNPMLVRVQPGPDALS